MPLLVDAARMRIDIERRRRPLTALDLKLTVRAAWPILGAMTASPVATALPRAEDLYARYVVPTAKRSLTLVRGEGRRAWDDKGKGYLDLGGGVAVSSLGHAHPAVTDVLARQSAT